MLEEYKGLEERIIKAAENTANRLVEEAVKEINEDDAHYVGVRSTKAKNNNGIITANYYTNDPIDIIKEFGTGIVGSANPSTSPFLKDLGGVTTSYGTYTMYDTNGHGEDGWFYPSGNGYRHTWGEIGRNVFTDVSAETEAKLEKVFQEELQKLLGG